MPGRHSSSTTPSGGTLVLDCAGLSQYALGDPQARAAAKSVLARNGRIVTAATTLTEVLRGGHRDAAVHRVLKTLTIEPITQELGRKAGKLLGRTGLDDGHRCALDSVIAVIAIDCARPVLLLTSDVKDLTRLTDEPDRPNHQRIVVKRV
jgi:predicted nucleic acid-binding protein